MSDDLLNVKNLFFSFGTKKILENFSLTLNSNEVVTLIGTSGVGKTTLFKILTGMLTPEQGIISFTKSLAYMTQEDLLLPWRTVLQNLSLPAELGKRPFSSPFLKNEALDMLSQLGLENCANAYPEQLSGGMRQRVSLARALLQKCPLLLLDEPFSNLDVILREQIYILLRQIKAKTGCTILMITHDFREALLFSDRILLMKKGTIQNRWQIDSKIHSNPIQMDILSKEIHAKLNPQI